MNTASRGRNPSRQHGASMAPAPRTPSRPPAQPAVVMEQDEGSDIDPMEWVLAIVFALAIPIGTYVVIDTVFADGESHADQMRRNESVQRVEPALTLREVEMRLEWVRPIIEKNVHEFLKRAAEQETPNDIHRVCTYGYRALGLCAAELEAVRRAIEKSPEVRKEPRVEQEIRRYLATIQREMEKFQKLSPHPDRLPPVPTGLGI